MDKIVVEYNISKERVFGYEVYLTNDFEDIVYICKYSPNVLNTLFDNIILLELSNWNRVIQGTNPLRTIDDYTSLMFELDTGSHKQLNTLLKRVIDRNMNLARFQKKFQEYRNVNKIIPIDLWEKQIV